MNIILPSEEQKAIIHAAFFNQNCIVNAVSGSGKTTCILSLARFIKKKILQVTYNKSLRHEVKKKARLEGLDNLSIHTYHSLAVKYYDRHAYIDGKINEIVVRDIQPENIELFDIIVLDETQDLTMPLFRLMKKFIRDMGHWPILLILGDENQDVYSFMGANRRYLTMADRIWFRPGEYRPVEFTRLPLRTSYRLTRQIASFINEVMLGEERIVAVKDGPPVDYIVSGSFNGLMAVMKIFEDGAYNPGDIFILLASVKTHNERVPFKYLENSLVEHGWPVFIPISDDSALSDKVTEGKIVFSTFHQAKGRERPIVVILGFDNSYFRYNARGIDPSYCPSTLYVAASRASHRLIILDSSCDGGGPLPFLKNYGFAGMPFVFVHGVFSKSIRKIRDPTSDYHECSAVSLTKFLRESTLLKILQPCENLFRLVRDAGPSVQLLSEYKKEEVSDINGLVIPMIHEYLIRGRATVMDYVTKVGETNDFVRRYLVADRPKCSADFLRIAVVYHALSTGLLFKLVQIKDYFWLNENEINWCLQFLNELRPIHYEHSIEVIYKSAVHGNIHLAGRLDIVEKDSVYEIKCVDTITIEHKLQLLIYAVICGLNPTCLSAEKFRIMNIKNGQCFELINNRPVIMEIFECLLDNKLSSDYVIDDEKFLILNSGIDDI